MDQKLRPLEVMIIGAGNRGMYAFGEISKKQDVDIKIVGVADPVEERREKMRIEHNIPGYNCFNSGEQALEKERFCDAVIITSPDSEHVKLALTALKQGYHVLLEKPMATNPVDCLKIIEAQKKSKKVLMVAHVLRYSPFFQKLKAITDSNEFGKILNIDLLEEIGYWHYAHSYVRGNWRNSETSGPVILTKSCHDMDLLTWYADSDVLKLFSEGSLKYFVSKNCPKGATKKCTDSCKVKKTCQYNAEGFYLQEKDPENVKWPLYVISPVDKTIQARKKALKEGPYGRCVWKCDNNVCDNQELSVIFKNGVKARFTLTAFGSEPTRRLKIYAEKGEIHGDLGKSSIITKKYSGLRGEDVINRIDIPAMDHHGGGDEHLLKNFIKTVRENNEDYNLTGPQESLQSHLMCFAAEESRKKDKVIDFQSYKKSII